MELAPASRHALTTSSSCCGRVRDAGQHRGDEDAALDAGVDQRGAAPRRAGAGEGCRARCVRQTASSSVPIEKLMPTVVRLAASTSRSRSRRIIVDFVRIENGFRASESTSISPRVSR